MTMKALTPRLPVDTKGLGFNLDKSASPHWITDGNLLIPTKEMLRTMTVEVDESSVQILESQIQQLWSFTTRAPARRAWFVGCAMTDKIPIALLFDGFIFTAVDPYRLSFGIQATEANRLEVDKNEPKSNPVRLYRDDKPVALLMPMRYRLDQLSEYVLKHGEISLEIALAREAEAVGQ
jgi:hypothetical protein